MEATTFESLLDELYGEEKKSNISEQDIPDINKLTFQHLKDVGYDLGLIDLCWPDEIKFLFEDRTQYPIRYVTNTEKEKTLLLYTKNFRKKFTYLYPDRKPLFLAKENECGILKMVSTTIRPTAVPYPVFEMWDSAAQFIGDYIKFETLEDNPKKLPNRLYSPQTTLMRQSGHCFEIATVLCSILIGVGYDAYIVSGYADKDLALRILLRVDCPYPPFKEEEEKLAEPPKILKYAIVPPNEFKSKFFTMMEQRELDKIVQGDLEAAERKKKQLLEEEKPPFDDLKGQRVHGWILIKAGSKGITENFFIEPTTGSPFKLDSGRYFGIESVWNHENYWVNIQDPAKMPHELDYDLANNKNWIHLLAGESFALRKEKPKELGDDDARDMYVEKHLDMPLSWSMRLHIPHDRFYSRFPDGGCRITNYKRVIVEQYAPFASKDGVVKKITRFTDFLCTDPFVVEEEFENREDKLSKAIYDCVTKVMTHYFSTGRDDAVYKHVYTKENNAIDSNRTIYFNHMNRGDYLYKLEVEENKITEHFRDRHDNLNTRITNYVKESRSNKPGYKHKIHTIFQKYNRNDSKPSHQDVAHREFALIDREIRLKYHYGPNNITASTRVFQKPSVTEWGEDLDFTCDLTFGYQAEVDVPLPRQVELYQMFHFLLKEEETCVSTFRQTEEFLSEFLVSRKRDLKKIKLIVPIFNREQNEKFKKQMLEKDKSHVKEKVKTEEIDYLAPYVVKYGGRLTLQQAKTARTECLREFKETQVTRANRLYDKYKELDTQVKEMKLNLAENYESFSDEAEAEYLNRMNELINQMKLTQVQANRQKALANTRYKELEYKLRRHPLLAILFQK